MTIDVRTLSYQSHQYLLKCTNKILQNQIPTQLEIVLYPVQAPSEQIPLIRQ